MKKLLKRKIHDVSTYVKMNSKRPYGECAIVMISTVLLVLSSMTSTDSVNMESANVDAAGGEIRIAAAPAEAEIREKTEDDLIASGVLSVRAMDVLPAGGEAKRAEKNSHCLDKNESLSKDMEEKAAKEGLTDRQPSVTEVTENREADLSEPEEVQTVEPVETDGMLVCEAESPEAADVSITASEHAAVESGMQEMAEAIPAASTVEAVPEAMVPEISAEEINVSAGETEVTDCADISAEQNTCGLSAADYDALCRIVEAEAGTEGEQGKLLVANVILNRVAHPSFPGTIEGVITDSGQFSPVQNGSYQSAVATPETISAVNRALGGENISMGALYFKSVRSDAEWGNRTLLYNYGNHNFYL